MIGFYNNLIMNGVNPTKPNWENELTKKVNVTTFVSILYMFVATLFVHFMGFHAFFYECLSATCQFKNGN